MWRTVLGARRACGAWRAAGSCFLPARASAGRQRTETLFADVLKTASSEPVFERQGADGFPPAVQAAIGGLSGADLPVVDTLAIAQAADPLAYGDAARTSCRCRPRFDLMMRPAGPTTFSNFDHLPLTLEHPEDFPNMRLSAPTMPTTAARSLIAPHLAPFFGPRAKELLITAKGPSHGVAAGGSRPGALWRFPPGGIRRASRSRASLAAIFWTG